MWKWQTVQEEGQRVAGKKIVKVLTDKITDGRLNGAMIRRSQQK